MKKFKYFILPIVLSVFLLPPLFAGAQNMDCSQLDNTNTCPEQWSAAQCMRCFAQATGETAQLTDVDKPFPVIVGEIIRGLLGFLGIIFLILIMYAGFLWMTAAGNDERITKAKKILSNSAIGLFIVVVSFSLTTWVFDVILESTGTNP